MNEEISIGNLATLIIELLDEKAEIIIDQIRIRPDKSEVERLYCDNSKLIKNTNWRQKYSLETGLKETIKWIKNNLNIYKAEIYNV